MIEFGSLYINTDTKALVIPERHAADPDKLRVSLVFTGHLGTYYGCALGQKFTYLEPTNDFVNTHRLHLRVGEICKFSNQPFSEYNHIISIDHKNIKCDVYGISGILNSSNSLRDTKLFSNISIYFTEDKRDFSYDWINSFLFTTTKHLYLIKEYNNVAFNICHVKGPITPSEKNVIVLKNIFYDEFKNKKTPKFYLFKNGISKCLN